MLSHPPQQGTGASSSGRRPTGTLEWQLWALKKEVLPPGKPPLFQPHSQLGVPTTLPAAPRPGPQGPGPCHPTPSIRLTEMKLTARWPLASSCVLLPSHLSP